MEAEYNYKIVTEVTETSEQFIFETVQPFCEEVAKTTISKEWLEKAIIHELQRESIQPKPRTGKWLVYTDCEGKTRQCVCDQCGYKTGKYTWKNPNFCEDCGAKMEVGE